ncbi:MAG: cysteine--tRNA ligase [Anaerolineales bacterium]|nr:cysteine--tRNA ligase [Anaerolineales bacterium]
MPITVYNTLSRRKEEFKPLVEGRVHIYVCGPTVYDHPHIGHAKTYVAFDTIVRFLRYAGHRVRYVQNITDVGHILDSGEDRILKGAARERIEPMEVVERYTRSYFEAMDALGVQRPDISPRASAHIPEQIELTKTLLAKGHAYEAGGSVYFDVHSFPEYGKLSGRKVEELEEGTRVAARDEKRHAEDFALWKNAPPEHILKWPSPWGWGYPGWHIECSAMATKYLGETFDLHGGGVDNIFPHNECEIAQSEAAFGQPFANYWLLTGSLTLDGVKMSKSLGNVLTVKDALARWRPEAIRFFILSGHYRSPIDFSGDAIDAAAKGWERATAPANALRERLRSPDLPDGGAAGVAPALAEIKTRFVEAMSDDFNSPVALSGLFELSKLANSLLNTEPAAGRGALEAVLALYEELGGQVLGVLPAASLAGAGANAEREAALIRLLIEMRAEARARKDFAASDKIRDRLKDSGVILEDGKAGTTWKLG